MSDNLSNALNQNWESKVILVVEDVDTNKIFFDAALRRTKATRSEERRCRERV